MALLRIMLSRRGSRLGPMPLMSMASVACGVVIAIVLSTLVIENVTQGFDEAALLALRRPEDLSVPIGPSWLLHMVIEINSLGSVTVLAIVTILATGYMLLSRMKVAAGYMLMSVLGGWAVSNAIKFAVARPRPAIVPHLMDVYDPSYPSGHAMMSAVTYLTIAALLSRTATMNSQRFFFLIVASLLAFAIGLCRIYLGVHYPTDVLAGWCFGATWALLAYQVGSRLPAAHATG